MRTLERLAAPASAAAVAKTPPGRELSAEERDFETRLRERYGTPVALVRGARGGRLEFRFGGEEELIRLGDLLLGDT